MIWNYAKITIDVISRIENMHITVLIRCQIDFSRITMYDYVDKVIRDLLCCNNFCTSFSWVRVQFILTFLPIFFSCGTNVVICSLCELELPGRTPNLTLLIAIF